MSENISVGAIGGGTVATVLGIMYAIYKCINHKQIHSKCCDKDCIASIDIESTPTVTLAVTPAVTPTATPVIEPSRAVAPRISAITSI